MRGDYKNMRDYMIARDRARRDYQRRDMRNPYGSKGGYVSSDRARRDYRMHDYRMNDYKMNDYNDYDMDYAQMNEDYKMDLEDWAKDLKRKTRSSMTKSEILSKAQQMGVNFDNYDEMEFYTTTMMLMSDFPNVGQPETYIAMAKQWLEDDDAELTGSEKLCAYLYTIVKGE